MNQSAYVATTWRQFLCHHCRLKFDKRDERRYAGLTLSNFGCTDDFPGCANARAARKQAVDNSEYCGSRMEAILVTTAGGHERLERARDRFALAVKEREDEEPQRKRHRLRAKRSSLSRHQHRVFEATARKEAVAAVRRCRLRQRDRHLNHRKLQKRRFGTGNRNDRCNRQTTGESQRGEGSIQKYLKPRTAVAVAAAAVKAQPTLKLN